MAALRGSIFNRTPVPGEPMRPGSVLGRTSEGRPIVVNARGGLSTEYKMIMTVERGGEEKFVVIPTMFGGKFLEPQAAMGRVIDAGWKDPETGRKVKFHDDLKGAETEEKELGARLRRDPNIKRAFDLFRSSK